MSHWLNLASSGRGRGRGMMWPPDMPLVRGAQLSLSLFCKESPNMIGGGDVFSYAHTFPTWFGSYCWDEKLNENIWYICFLFNGRLPVTLKELERTRWWWGDVFSYAHTLQTWFGSYSWDERLNENIWYICFLFNGILPVTWKELERTRWWCCFSWSFCGDIC